VTRDVRRVAVAAVAALALAGCAGSPMRAGAAALIGSSRISTEELARRVDEGLADPAAAQLAADRAAYQRDVLSRLISGEVVDEAARREGVTVTPGEVDAQYAALQASVGGADELRQQAAAAGLSLDRVRDLARTRAQTAALGDTLTADVPVPREQLEQAYQAGLDTYDRVRTAQVQLASLAEAQALLPQARGLSDEAFGQLARTRSLDEATKDSGGDLGFLPRSGFAGEGLEDYGTAAFAAKPGDTFAVASPRGGHLVRVLQRRTTTPEQAAPELRRTVLQQQRDTAVQALLAKTAASLDITVNPRFGSWDGQALSVVDRAATGPREVSSPEAPAGGPAAPQGDPAAPGGASPPDEQILPSPQQ